MIKVYFLLMMSLFCSAAAQEQPVIHETYPPGQEFYQGGRKHLYQDINHVLMDRNFARCDDPDQIYTASVLVREDSRVSFVKDFDSANIAKNRCAYDLFRKVLPHLKGWTSAGVAGKPANAIAQVRFVPAKLFEGYEAGYSGNEVSSIAEFPGGISAFRTEFIKHFNINAVDSEASSVRIELTFVVNERGVMEDVQISGEKNWDMAVEAVRAVSQIKTRWKPAIAYGLPVKYRVRMPLGMNFE